MKSIFLSYLIAIIAWSSASADGFFEIKNIRVLPKPGNSGAGIWTAEVRDPVNPKPAEFVPCIEVQLSTDKNIRSDGLFAKAYFFDGQRKLITKQYGPEKARRDGKKLDSFDMPIIFPGGSLQSVYFKMPKEILERKEPWSVVMVFGDRNEAQAKVYPDGAGAVFGFDFPEKNLVVNPTPKKDRSPVTDPVIEHVVQTRNPKHPKITLFLRFPNSISDGSEVQGVLAMCVLANSVGEIKRQLQDRNPKDYGALFRYADQHKFAILCWGAQTLWRPDASYDELERATNIELDRSFDIVAMAWERGVGELSEKYGIPTRNYLLWGICASAQWAHRLVLRKPDHFLAAYIHIPSSFDKPTPDAARVLWLLTSGELDGGYQHGMRWYTDCRAAGYPMIYKAFMNLGHAGSPAADNLGIKFFDYALSVKDQRDELDKSWAEMLKKKEEKPQPWLASFRNPEYVGDYLNQEVFPFARMDKIPTAFRVPLPTKSLADAWDK